MINENRNTKRVVSLFLALSGLVLAGCAKTGARFETTSDLATEAVVRGESLSGTVVIPNSNSPAPGAAPTPAIQLTRRVVCKKSRTFEASPKFSLTTTVVFEHSRYLDGKDLVSCAFAALAVKNTVSGQECPLVVSPEGLSNAAANTAACGINIPAGTAQLSCSLYKTCETYGTCRLPADQQRWSTLYLFNFTMLPVAGNWGNFTFQNNPLFSTDSRPVLADGTPGNWDCDIVGF